MLDSNVVAVVGADGRYVLAEALIDLVAGLMFDKADLDGDGSISITEVMSLPVVAQCVSKACPVC